MCRRNTILLLLILNHDGNYVGICRVPPWIKRVASSTKVLIKLWQKFWNFNFICNLFGANGSFNSIISFYSIYLPSDLTTVVTKHFLNFYKTMWKTFNLLDDKYAWCNVSEVWFFLVFKVFNSVQSYQRLRYIKSTPWK